MALRLLTNVTKVFVEEIGCVDSVSGIVERVIRKFDSKSIFESAVKFVKVCLSVHYANLRKLSYSKSLMDGAVKIDRSNVILKVKNMEVEKLLSNILRINNERLNKALEPLICYSFIQSELKNREESEGIKKAMEIALLGDRFDARAAADMGMINFVVPAAELAAETAKLAQRLANGPTHVYGNTKRLLYRSLENEFEAQLQMEAEAFADCAIRSDFREGVMAFVEKRKARFTGQ